MSGEVEVSVDLASVRRLLYRHPLGKIFGSVGGDAMVKFVPPPNTVPDEVARELGDGVAELMLSRRTISISGSTVQVALPGDFVKLELSKENLITISLEVPIEIARFDLSRLNTAQKVKGSAELSVVLSLEFVPNYRRIASRESRAAVQKVLRKQGQRVVRLAQRGRRIGKVVVHTARRALSAPFRKLADSLARNLAKNAVKLGSQTAALRKLLRGLGKLAGAGGIVLDAYLIAQEQVPIQLARVGRQTQKRMHLTWANAYAEFLAAMTASNWTASRAGFFELKMTIQRLADPVPNLYGSYRQLVDAGELRRPTQNPADWRDKVVKQGARMLRREVPLAEVDWVALYQEAFNVYFLFADAALHASGASLKSRAQQMVKHADYLTKVAGTVAAYHDIVNFLMTSGFYADANQTVDSDRVWEDWDDIVALHQVYYGTKRGDRINRYVHLTADSLDVQVLPFSDFPQPVASP